MKHTGCRDESIGIVLTWLEYKLIPAVMFKEDECMSPQLNCELIVNLCSLLNKQTQHKPSPYVFQAI